MVRALENVVKDIPVSYCYTDLNKLVFRTDNDCDDDTAKLFLKSALKALEKAAELGPIKQLLDGIDGVALLW